MSDASRAKPKAILIVDVNQRGVSRSSVDADTTYDLAQAWRDFVFAALLRACNAQIFMRLDCVIDNSMWPQARSLLGGA